MGCDLPRILDAEDEDTKEVILGTPTDKSEKLHLDIYDSAHKTNVNIYSSGKMSKLVTPFGKRSNKFVVKFNIDDLSTTETVNGIHDHENLEDDIIKRIQPIKAVQWWSTVQGLNQVAGSCMTGLKTGYVTVIIA